MTQHMKRQSVPKNWPIARKGTAYVVSADSGEIPLLIILRDMLKVAKTRAEVKRALHEKNILINNKIANDEKQGASLFDVVTIVPMKKHYKLTLEENGKYKLEEVKESEATKKVVKLVDKKILKGKKTQLNFSDGRNFISDMKCQIDDSVVVDLKNKKISSCLPIKEKANVLVFAGKHAGKEGKIEKLEAEKKMALLDTKHGKLNILIKQIIVTE